MTDIDAFISETISEGMAAIDQNKQAETNEQTAGEGQEATAQQPEDTVEGGWQEEGAAPDKPEGAEGEDAFPKKAVNALNRKDKKIYKLQNKLNDSTQRIASLEQQIYKLKSEISQAVPPQEMDFETYGEYLNALNRFNVKQELSERDVTNAERGIEETRREAEAVNQEVITEQISAIEESYQRVKHLLPDYMATLDRYAEPQPGGGPTQLNLKDIPREALAMSEEGALALYGMMKDGALADFNQITNPYQAANIVNEYIQHGRQQIAAKTKSKAPKPITATTGAGAHTPTLKDMSPDKLVEHLLS